MWQRSQKEVGKKPGNLEQHRARATQVGTGQGFPFRWCLIRPRSSRQIINESAKLASEIFIVQFMYNWHGLFKVEQDCFMGARMLLMKVHGQVSRHHLNTAEGAMAAQRSQGVQVLPQVRKPALGQDVLQSMLLIGRQRRRKDGLKHVVCDHKRGKGLLGHAMKAHCKLPEWYTNVLGALSIQSRVAITSEMIKRIHHGQGQSLGAPPQSGMCCL